MPLVFCPFMGRIKHIDGRQREGGARPVIRKNQRLINGLNLLSDIVLVFFAYFAAFLTRFALMDGQSAVHWSAHLAVAAAYSTLVVGVYYFAGMYGSYRFKRADSEALTILLINGVGVLCLMAVLYLARLSDLSRVALLLLWLFSSLLVIGKRTSVRALLRHYRKLGYNQKHVVVVGSGHFACQYVQDVAQNPHMGFAVDGYVSDAERPEAGRRLGGYADLEQVLTARQVDEVVVALEPEQIRFMKEVLATADKTGVRISIIPFYNDYIPTHPTVDVVGRTKLVNMRTTPLDNVLWQIVKRAVDLAGSLCLIVLASPVMLAAAVGVKLSSPGPVIFRQERVGRDKKPFWMYKFRSMRVNDAEVTGWTTDADPRKTKFGSFIRKFSIDELPQLFNVLKGEMSLVGPRPEIPFYVRQFKEEVPLYLVRQQVRPGMTGWAQVHGLRGDTSIEKRVEYDIWYIENWSLWLDVKILFRTAFGGLKNSEKLTEQQQRK